MQNIDVEAEDDEHRTALVVSIESGNVLDNENATSILLEAGSHLDRDIWDKLLILAADHDLIVYPRIANKLGILSLRYKNDESFSLHKVIKCEAINLLQFLTSHLEARQIKKAALKKDVDGRTAIDICEDCENEKIKVELHQTIDGIEIIGGSDSDTLLEDEIIQSINEEVLIKSDDENVFDSYKNPMAREQEKEYLLKLKEEFDNQYKTELIEKETIIKKLKDVVVAKYE
jgi:hypothetical protein